MKYYFEFIKLHPLMNLFWFIWWPYISWRIIFWILRGSWALAAINAICFLIWLFSYVSEFLYFIKAKQTIDQFIDDLYKATQDVLKKKMEEEETKK